MKPFIQTSINREVSGIKTCFPVFCVRALELSTLCLGTCILLSLGDPVSPSPWVGCDPASLQLLRVADSHPGAHAIRGMYLNALYALCPFLKFSKNPTGHRSSHWTEANDKNSHWYAGHLKILAAVWSYLEDSLVRSKNVGIFFLGHFVPMLPEKDWEGIYVQRKGGGRGLDDEDVLFHICNLILLRKCQSAGERLRTSDSPGP